MKSLKVAASQVLKFPLHLSGGSNKVEISQESNMPKKEGKICSREKRKLAYL
jgi:hypothetical protein